MTNDARDALADGVADRVVPDPELDAEADRIARTIAANGPVAVRLAKRAIDAMKAFFLSEGGTFDHVLTGSRDEAVEATRRSLHEGAEQVVLIHDPRVPEDAMHATKAAVEEGIVPGGGVALLRSQKSVEKAIKTEKNADQVTGMRIVHRALEEPLRRVDRAGEHGLTHGLPTALEHRLPTSPLVELPVKVIGLHLLLPSAQERRSDVHAIDRSAKARPRQRRGGGQEISEPCHLLGYGPLSHSPRPSNQHRHANSTVI